MLAYVGHRLAATAPLFGRVDSIAVYEGERPLLELCRAVAAAATSRPVGVPKTGIFGLLDLAGLDLQPHVDKSMAGALAKDDAYDRVKGELQRVVKRKAEALRARLVSFTTCD